MKKNVIPILGYLSILSIVTVLLFSCKKSIKSSSETDGNNDNSVYEYIQKLGYKDSEIQDMGAEYLVDGDIVFAKNSNPDFSQFGGPKAEQYGSSNYIGYDVQPNLLVYVDPSANGYINEITDAVALWNNVPSCRLNFAITSISGAARIRITMANIGSNVCGQAYFPMNGQPGSLIRLNPNLFQNFLDYGQRMSVVAHEIGHTIGFRHTNWINNGEPTNATDDVGANVSAMHILGTPTGTDANSIMNGSTCGVAPTSLSAFDILAVQFLYPENAPVAGTVPVFRYYARNTWQDHFYTTHFSEVGNGNNSDYIFEGIGFFAFTDQVANSVPVYRWYRTGTGDHFYTPYANEIPPPPSNYEGIAFYAYPSAINGSVPIHRYYHGGFDDHFYTKNQNELNTMAPYNYEGVNWFAY